MEDRDKLLNYGYRWVGMKLIDPSTACSLFGVKNIYKLYHDNTESLVETGTEEILSHSADGGLLGIEKTREEIKKQLEYIEKRDEVCCTFGCKGEKEELLVELEKLENELERV